jgi:hypothetical protein
MSQEFSGSCYCGNITVIFRAEAKSETLQPRTCDCGFCRRNGAEWVSDPDGRIDIAVMNEAALSLYEQGSEMARFWICQRCGTTTAVTAEINGKLHGAINANCLEGTEKFADSKSVSPKSLSDFEKRVRWEETWTSETVVKEAWDVGL